MLRVQLTQHTSEFSSISSLLYYLSSDHIHHLESNSGQLEASRKPSKLLRWRSNQPCNSSSVSQCDTQSQEEHSVHFEFVQLPSEAQAVTLKLRCCALLEYCFVPFLLSVSLLRQAAAGGHVPRQVGRQG